MGAILLTLMPLITSIPAYASGDTTIPTITAVVNNGMLTVDATDDQSGIAAVYINGFEFTDLSNGSITIRMQQYDTGYQYFTMQAKDGAGNLSEVYRVNNPYYTFPDEDNGEEVEDETLPKDAKPTKPASAEGEVTDHYKTDRRGNKTDRRRNYDKDNEERSNKSTSTSSSSSSTMQKATEEDDDEDYGIDNASLTTQDGREFYTIMTKSGKTFYLVVDRTKDEETVHFLTDITENDLLNVTDDTKPTLPQNSAIVIKDAGLEAGSGRDGEEKKEEETEEPDTVSADDLLIEDTEPETGDMAPEEEISPFMDFLRKYGSLMIIGLVSLLTIGAYLVVKHLKQDGDENFVEDEEAEDEDEIYAQETEPEKEDNETEDFLTRMAKEDEKEKDEPPKTKTEEEPVYDPSRREEPEKPKEEQEEPKEEQKEEPKEEPVYTATGSTLSETTADNEAEEEPEEEEEYA